jgi:hypothetical protein
LCSHGCVTRIWPSAGTILSSNSGSNPAVYPLVARSSFEQRMVPRPVMIRFIFQDSVLKMQKSGVNSTDIVLSKSLENRTKMLTGHDADGMIMHIIALLLLLCNGMHERLALQVNPLADGVVHHADG